MDQSLREDMEMIEEFIHSKYSKPIANLFEGAFLLDKVRHLKKYLEYAAADISEQMLDLFREERVEEFCYNNKVVKPGFTVRYDCQNMQRMLTPDLAEQLKSYQSLRLGKRIVDLAIEEGVLEGHSIEDYIRAGFIERKVKYCIKFCDPGLEKNRLERQGIY